MDHECKYDGKIDKLGEDVAVLLDFKKSTETLFNQIRGFLIVNIGTMIIGGALLAWVILKK